jgi:hypothetical protein
MCIIASIRVPIFLKVLVRLFIGDGDLSKFLLPYLSKTLHEQNREPKCGADTSHSNTLVLTQRIGFLSAIGGGVPKIGNRCEWPDDISSHSFSRSGRDSKSSGKRRLDQSNFVSMHDPSAGGTEIPSFCGCLRAGCLTAEVFTNEPTKETKRDADNAAVCLPYPKPTRIVRIHRKHHLLTNQRHSPTCRFRTELSI